MDRSLDPEAAAHLAEIAALPHLETLPVDEARALYLAGFRRTAGPAEQVEEISDQLLPGAVGELPIRVYSPSEPHGTLVFLHGGGWTIGNIESHDVICRAIARRARCRVVSVEYRLAPEHPYPRALEDAWLALTWAVRTFDARWVWAVTAREATLQRYARCEPVMRMCRSRSRCCSIR